MSASPDPDPRRSRVRVGVGAALVLVLASLVVAVLVAALSPRGTTAVLPSPRPSGDAPPFVDEPVLYVHVLGEVAQPGLYRLDEGARVVDAIAAAGGLTDDAELAAVNLARPVTDGEQLVVPRPGEAPAAGVGAHAPPAVVHLNTADVATLETLPRIGPALAERIVAWRDEHGGFATVDDLLAVSGIGAAILDGLRDRVTV